VLVGLFWTDPDEIDRSFPLGPMRAIAASGPVGGWVLRRGLAAADTVAARVGLSASFMIRWARELVVDRTVLVYAPTLHDRIGPRLGPLRIFSELGFDIAHQHEFAGTGGTERFVVLWRRDGVLAKAESYHTQWTTNRQMNSTTARQIEQTQANINAAQQAAENIRQGGRRNAFL
jgi:hypothetical protein